MRRIFIVYLLALQSTTGCSDSSQNGHGYCDEPIAINGTIDTRAPGYIFLLKDSFSVVDELNRMTQHYDGLEVGAVYETINGFFADMDADTIARLRCEPVIATIDYNGLTTVVNSGTKPSPASGNDNDNDNDNDNNNNTSRTINE